MRKSREAEFLALAISGRAGLIGTGGRDLRALDPFRDIPIVTPAAYVARWGEIAACFRPIHPSILRLSASDS
ncbi:MAG: hypothetical protein ACREEE_16725 [Dongiaceae bacterium]